MSDMHSYLARIRVIAQAFGNTLLLWGKLRCEFSSEWAIANWPQIKNKLTLYIQLTRMNKPIGSLLLLWPTLWALWIAAKGLPSLHLFIVFVMGTFLARSAGCVMNDYADQEFDLHVERTKFRPLATAKVSTKEAFTVAIILLLLAFLLVLTTNRLCVLLSLVAIPLATIYPYMKRHTYLPQFFLGLAYSWGVPMAFAAQTGEVPTLAWLVFIANLLWVVVFDTIYAMVDREYDLEIGIKSTAILFDDADRMIIGIIQCMVLLVLAIIGNQLEFSWIYYTSLAVAAGFSAYQQFLIRDGTPEKCFQAFLNNNWFGASVFTGITLHYLYL